MMVSWYTQQGKEKLEAGVFHNEQSLDLKKHCNVALYYPFDKDIEEAETKQTEWGLLTYRSKYHTANMLQARRQIKKTMARIVEEFQPDIIHAHCASGAGFYAIAEGKRYHIPVVITEHTPVELSGADHFSYGRLLAKKAYANSSANVCVSRDSRDKLQRLFPKCQFQVIYNGIIPPDYRKGRKDYYRDGYMNVVIVAVLYDLEIKGMKYLLEAVKILKERGEKFVLHHIGGGEYLEHFQNLAVELGIEDVCVFHGICERKRLYEIVSEMDFFVSASLMECSGVSVQEAMLLAKPVLGTNSGGVDSLVPEQAGHIVEKANSQALAEGMLYMREHLPEYDREWIQTYAQESFEIGHISERYLELYREVLENWN